MTHPQWGPTIGPLSFCKENCMDKEKTQGKKDRKKPALQKKLGKSMEDPRYLQQDDLGNYDIDGTSYDGNEISLAGDKTSQNPKKKLNNNTKKTH